jgi:hypothetical protein
MDMPSLQPPDLDEEGYPLNGFDDVIPGLAQADTTFDPRQMFALGFDALFDLCGWDRGDGLEGEPYVFYLIDDVPWIVDHQAIHDLGVAVATLVRSGARVAVNCAAGLNRSGLLVGRALIELGHEPAEAIHLVRAARGPRALSNVAFTKFLLLDCSRSAR